MKIVIISGSSRPNSQTRKIADWVQNKLQAMSVQTALVDLHESLLPLDQNILDFKTNPKLQAAWEPFADALSGADAVQIISPEWDGMAPPALMNFFVFASEAGKPLAHKPMGLITVSSTDGGSYPAAELRVHGPKNNHTFYTPELMIIRHCEKVFNTPDPEPGNDADVYLQKRAAFGLSVLVEYAKAMKSLRETTPIDLLSYPNGM